MSGILLAARHVMAVKKPIVLPAIGAAFMGGFYAGIMDTTQAGSIPANDQSQGGKRYALIDLGKATENASIQYKTTNDAAPLACQTVWDGLTATQAMIAAGSAYPAAQYAAGVTVPSDGGSQAYIPAMWELLAIYWLFKPFTNNNYLTAWTGATFPSSSVTQGLDPASDPQRPAFTATVPGQTALTAWRTGGAQAFGDNMYWSSTESAVTNAWGLAFTTAAPGRLAMTSGKATLGVPLRLVRRVYL